MASRLLPASGRNGKCRLDHLESSGKRTKSTPYFRSSAQNLRDGTAVPHARQDIAGSRFAIIRTDIFVYSRQKKKGAPTCAGAPQRSGHCRVCAQTVVLGATS